MAAPEWPLTGRDDELRLLVGALRATGGAVLAGPAGVGKTRLAREVVARAAGSRGATRWAVASGSARTVPLGAFATFSGTAIGPVGDASLLARAAAVLRDGAAVIGVDDAHLLDSVSAALLHQLAAERAIRLVVTVRTGETAPDAVTALWKDGILERFEVEPLTRAQTGAVLAAALDGPVDHLSVARLFEVTRGNALWLRQLVDGERAGGRLARVGGVWHWAGEPHLTPALGALIDARIGELPAGGHEILELLALGEPVEVGVLTDLVDPGSVEEVVQRGLVTVEPERGRTQGQHARLAHPLFAEAVRARTGQMRARRLRGVLASVETASRPAGADRLRRAVLLVDSDLPPDPELLLAGAVEAAAVPDVWVAQRLVTAARDAGGGFEAQVLLTFLLSYTVRPEEAEHEFVLAEQLADTDDARVRIALARTFNLIILGRSAEGPALIDAAAATLADPARRTDLDAGRTVLALLRNDLPEAARLAARVLSTPTVGAAAVGYTSWAAAMTAALQGWDDASTAMVERGYAACAAVPEIAPIRLNIVYWEALGLALSGRPEAARAALTRFDAVAPSMRFMIEFAQAPIELAVGRIATAAQLCRDAMLYSPGTRGGWTEIVHGTLCQAHAMAGNAGAAAAAWDVVTRYRQADFACLDPVFSHTRAWLSAAQGAVTEAAELAASAAAEAQADHQWAIEVVARHSGVCFGDGSHAARLAELAELVPGPRVRAAAAHAAALVEQDAAGLLTAAEELASIGLLLLAADAAAQAATRHREQGHAGAALSAAARAAELARRCDGARTPALALALTPLPITAREREVANLARAGLSNKQIGDRLGVSVRTVEGHVYRACGKLGVADRAELAELVGKLS